MLGRIGGDVKRVCDMTAICMIRRFAAAAAVAVAPALVSASVAGPETRPQPRPVPIVPTVSAAGPETPRPEARKPALPRARWEHRSDGALWTRVSMASVLAHGAPLVSMVPEDITDWCPAYPDQDAEARAAFWTALLSTLSRYESTWNPGAVGGGGLWHGLMQILPSTAELRDCHAVTGAALRHGPSNLACAVRIMAVTVPRDGAISLKGTSRWQGVAADWGPIRQERMRRDMQRYTKRQSYCRPLSEVRPRARPVLE